MEVEVDQAEIHFLLFFRQSFLGAPPGAGACEELVEIRSCRIQVAQIYDHF